MIWYTIGTLAGVGLARLINPLELFRARRPHVHRGHSWDGYFEQCRCGASSGDRRNDRGTRCLTFGEWQ